MNRRQAMSKVFSDDCTRNLGLLQPHHVDGGKINLGTRHSALKLLPWHTQSRCHAFSPESLAFPPCVRRPHHRINPTCILSVSMHRHAC